MGEKRGKSRREEVWDIIENHCLIPFTRMEEFLKEKDRPIIEGANGIYLEDTEGNQYIDALGGIYCVNVGYGNRRVIEAIKEQVEKLPVLYYGTGINEPMVKLCQTLGKLAPGDLNRVRLDITGSDANEISIKIARAYFQEEGKNLVISLWGSYHGNTYGTLGMTGQQRYKESHVRNIAPGAIHIPPPNCYRCAYGLAYPKCNILCARMLEYTIEHYDASNVAAFIGEPVVGASIIVPPDEYWPMVRDICKKHNVLLILDEIVTGLGRTGKLFGCNHWNIEPDIMTLAKGLSSLYQPVSAVLIQDYIFEKLKRMESIRHSHTAVLHPVGCAAALANVNEVVEKDLARNAREMGDYLRERLDGMGEESPHVGDVRGRGLQQGVELVIDKSAKSRYPSEIRNIIQKSCREKGMIIRVAGYGCDTVFFTPPLIITKQEIDGICKIFSEVLGEIDGYGFS
jgi:adenosylmethionine-8-amino-7-oxononanoate aminotransferase